MQEQWHRRTRCGELLRMVGMLVARCAQPSFLQHALALGNSLSIASLHVSHDVALEMLGANVQQPGKPAMHDQVGGAQPAGIMSLFISSQK